MIGGGFLGGGISIVPAGKAIIYASLTTEDGANIPNAVFKAVRTGSTVTANGTIDGRAELLVDAGHTYTVTVTPAGGSYLNNSQTVATASAKSYAVKFYLYPAKANEASTTASLNALNTSISTHAGRTDNPHAVTKAQVGLGAYPTLPADIGISTATQTALDGKAEKVSTDAHINNKSNPHNVTKAQVGLSNVDNTSDAAKPISTATQTALDGKVSKTGNEEIAGTKTFTGGVYQKSTLDIGVAGGNQKIIGRLSDVNSKTLVEDRIFKAGDKATGLMTLLANEDENGTYFQVARVGFVTEDKRYLDYIELPNGISSYHRNLNPDGTGYSSTPYRPYSQATNNEILVKGHVADILAPKQDKFSLYEHTIRVWTTVASDKFRFTLTVLNQSPTEFTLPTLRNYLGSSAGDFKQCSGMVLNMGGTNRIHLTGVRGGSTTAFVLEGVNATDGSIDALSLDWGQVEVLHADKVRQIV